MRYKYLLAIVIAVTVTICAEKILSVTDSVALAQSSSQQLSPSPLLTERYIPGEIVALGVRDGTLVQARKLGFTVIETHNLKNLKFQIAKLLPPSGLGAERGLQILADQFSNDTFDLNHVYRLKGRCRSLRCGARRFFRGVRRTTRKVGRGFKRVGQKLRRGKKHSYRNNKRYRKAKYRKKRTDLKNIEDMTHERDRKPAQLPKQDLKQLRVDAMKSNMPRAALFSNTQPGPHLDARAVDKAKQTKQIVPPLTKNPESKFVASDVALSLMSHPNRENKVVQKCDDGITCKSEEFGVQLSAVDAGTTAIDWSSSRMACGANTKIGIIDTSADLLHPSLKSQKIELASFIPDNKNPASNKHGTAILSVIAGATDSVSPGIVPNSKLYLANSFHKDWSGRGQANVVSIAKALDWLKGHHVDVVNMSFSGPPNRILKASLDKLSEAGVHFVASVSLDRNGSNPSYPAAYSNVIGITAVNSNRQLYQEASFAEDVITYSAPGVKVVTALPGGGAEPQSGTSFASAYATAAIATHLDSSSEFAKSSAASAKVFPHEDLGIPGRDSTFGHGLILVPEACGTRRTNSQIAGRG